MTESVRRRIFIGDVHGCLGELELLAREVGITPDDEVILVGDLINKGPDSAGVLDWAKEHHARVILGNHEARLLKILATPEADYTPKEVRFLAGLAGRHHEFGEWIRTWPLWLDWGDVVCVHAGLEPGIAHLRDMRPSVLLTVRTWDGSGKNMDRAGDPPWYQCIDWPVPVVFGHWALGGLVDLPHVKGLDTGCVYGGKLTAWSPDEDKFWQVPALKAWKPFV
jgi:bis(5'-nucleosyl)-tetraphosphatase (symmetrical)